MDKLQEIGKNAYAAIVEMVDALNVDYDRLMELREQRQEFMDMFDAAETVTERVEISDELKDWKEANESVLLAYARCFYFGS